MADKELSSATLYFDAHETKKNKSFIEKLNRIGLAMEPWGAPENNLLIFLNIYANTLISVYEIRINAFSHRP